MTKADFTAQLVKELDLPAASIQATIRLLKEGNTIPFIARYRKEATGNLDEVQLRTLSERYQYLQEMEARRETILQSIESQGKLTAELKAKILSCTSKNTLEDLYLPYKPKRRTRAMIAREKGLEPLAALIVEQPVNRDPLKIAADYVDSEKGIADVEEALAGARDIVAEWVAEKAEIRSMIRDAYRSEGVIYSKVIEGKEEEAAKYRDYFDFQQMAAKIPSHRVLAIRRGEKEGVLRMKLEIPESPYLLKIERHMQVKPASPFALELKRAIADAYKRLLTSSVETDVRVEMKMEADRAAVEIFAENLRHLILGAPLGERSVIGIDPGLRTGCKCAAVDMTGKFLDTTTFYLISDEEKAAAVLLSFINKHKPFAIAVGNGTAGRETEAFVKKLLKKAAIKDVVVVQVNESGASVYSASDTAREEFPDLDLTIRGAISIARRLQDPLAELVKIDPKAIGVGQYQHDVYQPLLQQKLKDVVESCVNFVGVELNTASAELLSYVAGIGPSLARKIVEKRDAKGRFTERAELLEVPGLGERTYQQCVGFLRIRSGKNPLDASAVHPEQYPLVEKILKDLQMPLSDVIGNKQVIESVKLDKYLSEEAGAYTLQDILSELNKPGRDPRDRFELPAFRDDVMDMKDLKVGMQLEGVVTNVTAFGAFVDIGVHQDGLVHISELSQTFVKDPRDVVQVGQKLKVTIIELDLDRKRISLSAKGGQGKRMPMNSSSKQQKRFENSPFAGLGAKK